MLRPGARVAGTFTIPPSICGSRRCAGSACGPAPSRACRHRRSSEHRRFGRARPRGANRPTLRREARRNEPRSRMASGSRPALRAASAMTSSSPRSRPSPKRLRNTSSMKRCPAPRSLGAEKGRVRERPVGIDWRKESGRSARARASDARCPAPCRQPCPASPQGRSGRAPVLDRSGAARSIGTPRSPSSDSSRSAASQA